MLHYYVAEFLRLNLLCYKVNLHMDFVLVHTVIKYRYEINRLGDGTLYEQAYSFLNHSYEITNV